MLSQYAHEDVLVDPRFYRQTDLTVEPSHGFILQHMPLPASWSATCLALAIVLYVISHAHRVD